VFTLGSASSDALEYTEPAYRIAADQPNIAGSRASLYDASETNERRYEERSVGALLGFLNRRSTSVGVVTPHTKWTSDTGQV
jgi:hypothetical protein